MRAVKHPGECKICGQFKELTAEHIPPQNAFNSTNVIVFPFDEVIKTITEIPVTFWDERLTTVSAHRILSDNNIRGKKRKNVVDAVAAVTILQNYILST